jgi:hypothetical protein
MRKKDRRISKKKDQYLQSEKRSRSKTNNCSIFSILLFSLLLSFLSIKSTCSKIATEIRENLPIAQSPQLMKVEGTDKWGNIYYVNGEKQWSRNLENGSRQARIELKVLSWAGLTRFANGKNMLHERYVDEDKTIHVRSVEDQAPQEDCLSSVEKLNNCWRKVVEEYTFLPKSVGKRVTLKYESTGKGGEKESLSIVLQWVSPPIIKSFNLSPERVGAGDNVRISWEVLNSETRPVKEVLLNNAPVKIDGAQNIRVQPKDMDKYRTFNLVAKGPADQTAKSKKVQVDYGVIDVLESNADKICRNRPFPQIYEITWRTRYNTSSIETNNKLRWGFEYNNGNRQFENWREVEATGSETVNIRNEVPNAKKAIAQLRLQAGRYSTQKEVSRNLSDCINETKLKRGISYLSGTGKYGVKIMGNRSRGGNTYDGKREFTKNLEMAGFYKEVIIDNIAPGEWTIKAECSISGFGVLPSAACDGVNVDLDNTSNANFYWKRDGAGNWLFSCR